MSLLGLLVLQGALWGLSYLLREDEEDTSDKDKTTPTTMRSVKPGSVVPIVFGRCLTTADPILVHSQVHRDPDLLRDVVIVDGQLPVGLVPNSGLPKYEFGHYYIGGILIERMFPVAQLSNYPQVVFTEYDLWGGPGNGGGVHSTFTYASTIYEVPGGSLVPLGDEWAVVFRVLQLNNEDLTLEEQATGSGGFTNTAYLLLNRFQIGEGEIIPRGGTRVLPSIEVESICIPSYPGMESLVNGYIPSNDPEGSAHIPRLHIEYGDANPASVLYCLLVDDVVGLSMDPTSVDFASFTAVAITLKAEGNGFSMLVDKPTAAEKLIKEVLKQIDGVLYSDPLTKQLSLKLVRQDYGTYPFATLLKADHSNCAGIVDFKVSLPDDIYNQVRVKFQNRAKHYQDDEAISQDSSSVNDGRATRSIDYTYPGVKTASLANALAARDLTRVGTPTTFVTIQVNREFIEKTPGDVILFDWPDYNITNMVLRIMQVDVGELNDGKIVLSCIQDKEALTAPSFGEPGTRTTPRTVVLPPLTIDTFEASDSSGVGEPDVSGDMWRGRMSLMVSSQDDTQTALVEWSRDQGLSYNVLSINLPVTPTGELSQTYDQDTHYDNAVGIVVLNVTGSFPTGPFTGAAIARGDNLIKIDEELLSFETSTDLGNNNYKLTGVWRGLLDTIPQAHQAKSSVTFLSGVEPSQIITELRPSEEGTILLKIRMRDSTAIQPDSEATYMEVDFKRRAKSPTAPDGLELIAFGVDELTSEPDVLYAYDVSDNQAVSNRVLSGSLKEVVTSGYVAESNDHQASWSRRDSAPKTIVRGDSVDTVPPTEDMISYRLEGKRETDDAWEVVDDAAYGNSNKGLGLITKNEGYLSLQKLLPGPNDIRMCAVRADEQTGESLCSVDVPTQSIDVLPMRQLLVNGKLAPFWDVTAPSSGAAYGKAQLVLGGDSTSARGWVSTGELDVVFGVPVSPLQQGDGTKGSAFWTTEASTSVYSTIEQVVTIPFASDDSINQTNSLAELTFYFYRSGAAFYSVTIEAVADDGSVVSTVTSTDVVVLMDTGWSKRTHALSVTSEASTLRVIISIRKDNKVGEVAISDAQLRMAPEISSQQLLNTTFITNFASWTTTGTWLRASSALGINQLTSDNGGANLSDFIYGTTPSGGFCTISQDVALLDEFGDGDYLYVEFWVSRLNSSSTNDFYCDMLCKDTGATIISKRIGSFKVLSEYAWYRYEGFLKIPPRCTDIGVLFSFKNSAGGATIDMALDGISMKLYKSDQRPVVLDYSEPTTQTAPSTAMQFAEACGDPRVLPLHIFEFNEPSGDLPVDSIQGTAFTDVIGEDGVDVDLGAVSTAPWDGETFTKSCLELYDRTGGIKCADVDFLNPQNRSIAIYFRYKLDTFSQVGKSNVLSKIPRNPSPINGAGFQIYFDADNSRFTMYLGSNKSGETAFSSQVHLTLAGFDSDTHWACFKIDLDNAVMSCFGDFAVGTATDLTDLQNNSFDNAVDEVFIGRNDVIGGLFADGFSGPFQLLYMAILKGSPVRRFTKDNADQMWTKSDCPNVNNPLTYTRVSELLLPVSDSEVMSFAGTASGSDAVPAISYWDSLSNIDKLALSCPEPTKNWITFSDKLSDAAWTKVGVIPTFKKGRCPLGLVLANEITQDSTVGGYVENVVGGLTIGAFYTFSLYLQSVATPQQKSSLIFREPPKANFFGSANAYETDYWDFQTLVGGVSFSNGVGSATLDNVSGLPQQTAYGVYNGIDATSYNTWESHTTSSGLVCSDTSVGDSNNEDFSLSVVLRSSKSPTTIQSIVGKLASTGSAGWLLYFSAGALRLYIEDELSSSQDFVVAGVHTELCDGAIHHIAAHYDESANLLYLRGDTFSQVTLDVSSVTGSLSNTQALRVGASHIDTLVNMQLLFVGITIGVDAFNQYNEDPSLPGGDPTGEMFIVDRDSTVSIPIDLDGHICHYGQDTLAIGQSGVSSDGLMSAAVNDAVQNLVTDSESLSNWVTSNATTVDQNVDAPDGFRTMSKVSANSDAAYVANVMTTVASTEYTQSLYIQNAESGDTSGRIIFYDESNSAEIASLSFTTNADIQRIPLTATSAVGQISTSFRIELDTLGTSIHAWGAQCELGAYMTFYVRSIGSATTSVRSRYSATFTTDKEFGEIKSVSSKVAVRGNVGIWNCVSTVGTQNRVRLISNSTNNAAQVYDAVGATEDSVVAAHLDTLGEEVNRYVWDQSIAGSGTGGNESILIYQGVQYQTSASPWEGAVGAGSEVASIDIGSIGGGFVQPGWYQEISSYMGDSTVPLSPIHDIKIELLRSDLTTVLDTHTKVGADSEWSRVSVKAQALDTSVSVRVYGGDDTTSKLSCRVWGSMLHDYQVSGGYPIVQNNNATLNTSPDSTQQITGMPENLLGNADEGRIELLAVMAPQVAGGGSASVVRLSGDDVVDSDMRLLYLSKAGGAGGTGAFGAEVNDKSGNQVDDYSSVVNVAEGTEVTVDIAWRPKAGLRLSGEAFDMFVNGADEGIIGSIGDAGAGMTELQVGGSGAFKAFDGGIQKLTIYGNGTPIIPTPATPAASRVWAKTVGEFVAAFPTIPKPSSLYTFQRENSLIPDIVSNKNLVGGDFTNTTVPTFGVVAEDGRVGVLMDSILDSLVIPDTSKYNLDGNTDMTYWFRVYLPAFTSTNYGIFSRRGDGAAGFPGFSVYISSSSFITVVQDGGLLTSSAFVLSIDHGVQYVDLAYVVDRSGNNEGRLETTLGTAVGSLSAVESLAVDVPLTLGRSQEEGRSALPGEIFTYGGIWEGVALDRAQLLHIWTPQ